MLPESTFPVTGGIMQTEEVALCSKSGGLDCSRTEDTTFDHPPHLKQDTQCPVPSLVYMTVKQEPQDVDANATSVQEDADSVAGTSDEDHHNSQPHQNIQETNGKTLENSQKPDANKVRPSRGRRKSRWKLKFHHQALPPEYLDHYEASLAQEALNASPAPVLNPAPAPVPAPTPELLSAPPVVTSSPVALNPIADVQRWLQRIAIMQQELCPPVSQASTAQPVQNFRRSVITSAPTQPTSYPIPQPQKYQQTLPRPPMKYSDLPYMGEITLDNSKPRRGRKPKKADICHLIYKNYGTILPGTPGHEDKRQGARDKCEKTPQMAFQRSDIQNRISSLLEKRLTQESRKSFILQPFKEQDEPLNLCIRDMNPLKSKHTRNCDISLISNDATLDQEDMDLSRTTPYSTEPDSSSLMETMSKKDDGSEHGSSPNPGFVYWPNAGVFIHPMALQSQLLYYQKMDQQRKNFLNVDYSPQEALKTVPKTQSPVSENKCVTPAISRLPPTTSQNTKRVVNNQNQPMKRKRSAIFIPPMPTENNNNPATEVSICKFKFTGGAKPSLQEKKSLSVDSGGNFRYYSGTGDKSMRGYEFFPRESLQQSANQSGSSTGTFLSAAAERIAQPLSHTEKNVMKTVNPDDGRRKRKTRKSLQREKLEQTFKEKGFLIQTQQLESAEGATYCKFRQLRKFTRYLFRSWKDYLPGNVRELTDGMEGEGQEVAAENEGGPAVTRPANLVDVPVNILEDSRILPMT